MEEVSEVFCYSENITIYQDGVSCEYVCGSDGYKQTLDGWLNLLEGSHQMPAFGVSINALTLKEREKGLWVEFGFKKEYEVSGLPFEKLLIEVNPDYYGFNIIRFTSDRGYDGRCFYIDLVNKNMADFYDILLKI